MDKRRHIRFVDIEGETAVLESDSLTAKPGLVLDESKSGCAVVFCAGVDFVKKGDICVLTIGEKRTFTAEVVRITELSSATNSEVCTVGFEYTQPGP